jgi:hypothetical protein
MVVQTHKYDGQYVRLVKTLANRMEQFTRTQYTRPGIT